MRRRASGTSSIPLVGLPLHRPVPSSCGVSEARRASLPSRRISSSLASKARGARGDTIDKRHALDHNTIIPAFPPSFLRTPRSTGIVASAVSASRSSISQIRHLPLSTDSSRVLRRASMPGRSATAEGDAPLFAIARPGLRSTSALPSIVHDTPLVAMARPGSLRNVEHTMPFHPYDHSDSY